MDGLIDYARRQIKCPECRAEHRIPYNGVQSFPNNVTLSRFLDLHRSITGEEPDPLPSQMDRCGVCGEKSFCLRCAHCEKKVCEECRAAHLDIMRREINRLNTQVRRGLGKLAENVCQFNKSGDKLVQLSAQIQDEITEGVRRLIRDLKDKESKLLAELEEFSVSEAKNSEKLKEDLEQELDTITSNCELVEAHITETDEWTDAELMEYKEIFLKTLDFLRNLDPDTMDFARKIKYIAKVDLENVRRTIADFGEIKIIPASCSMAAFGPGGLLSPSESTANLSLPQGSLSRSQSDHRLVAQLAKSGSRSDLQRSYLDVTGGNRYGSDSDRERGSSPPGKRGERFGSVRSYDDRGRYASAAATAQNSEFNYTRGWQRPGDTDYEPSNSSNFRSRFMRERIRERGGGNDGDHSFEEHEDTAAAGPRVRFQEEEAAQSKKAKLFDTEEMASLRAPLSGLIKLTDSPHFMERLHQNEAKAKLKAIEEANEATAAAIAPAPVSNVAPRPTRQVSEDEIEKQKKQAQAQAAAQSNNNTATPTTPKPAAAATTTATTEPPQQASNRRVQALQKEDTRSVRSSSEETSIASDETGGDGESATQEQQSSPPVSTRRRMFASSRANTSGNNNASSNGQKNSYSNDYNDSGNATRTAAQSSSAASSAAAAAAAAGNTPGNRQVSATTNNHTKNKTQKHTQTNKNSVSANIQVSTTSPSKVMASGAALTTAATGSTSVAATTTTNASTTSGKPTNSVGSTNNATTTPSALSSKSSSTSSFASANDNNNNPQQESIAALIQAYATPKTSSSSSTSAGTYQAPKNKYLTSTTTTTPGGGLGSGSVDLSDIYLSEHHPTVNSYTSSHHYPTLSTPTASSSFDAQLYRLTSPPPLPSSSASSTYGKTASVGSARHQYGPMSTSSAYNSSGGGSSSHTTSSSMLNLMSPGGSIGGSSNTVNNMWQPPVMPPSSAAILGMVENGLASGGGGGGGTSNVPATTSPNQSTDHFYRAFNNCLTLPCLNPLATVEPSEHTGRCDEAKHVHIGSSGEDFETTGGHKEAAERIGSTRKRIIRLSKDKVATGGGGGNDELKTTTTLDMYSPREFRGQDRPNYNPYRQSQTSIASNSSKYLPSTSTKSNYVRTRDANTGLLASSTSATDHNRASAAPVTTTLTATSSSSIAARSLYGTASSATSGLVPPTSNNNSTASTSFRPTLSSSSSSTATPTGFPNSSNARGRLRLYS